MTCKYGDPICPCQDGDPCHYEPHGDTLAMHVPPECVLRAVNANNEQLRAGLQGLVRAVEADGECQGYDPRSVGAAHTWVAIAMKEADALLSPALNTA